MQLYSEGKSYKLYQGNMLDMLDVLEPNSIDAIVTDPPYELGFMAKSWDKSGIAFQKETWEKCFQVLKPGGHLLAFGASRNFHRVACAIEDVGFEIRDTIMWLYGSGMPKSLNIGLAIDKKNGVESEVIGISNNGAGASPLKLNNHEHGDTGIGMMDGSGRTFEIKKAQNEWDGWGTSLKPAYESIVISRKPCEGSTTDNVLKYGVGGINIDECRIPLEDDYEFKETKRHARECNVFTGDNCGFDSENNTTASASPLGRFPSNVILTYDETDFEEVCGGMPDTKGGERHNTAIRQGVKNSGYDYDINVRNEYADEGSAARYFYCAKASGRDRDEGLDDFEEKAPATTEYGPFLMREFEDGNTDKHNDFLRLKPKRNIHPSVKPVDLMSYLVRLVTPKGGTVLDPFNGSGSTGKAVAYENFDREADYKYIGIELSEEYLAISDARIKFVENKTKQIKLF